MKSIDRRQEIQAQQYQFPYHYLPTLDEQGTIAIHKFLHFGLDYMTYMSFIVRKITQEFRPASVLDVGCGDGRLLHMLVGNIPYLVGVDTDERAILFARAFNPSLEFYVGNVSQVPGQYEVVALIEVMEHVPDEALPPLMSQILEKLQPGGRLIISVPTTNSPCSPKHYRHYDLALLKRHLAPAFTIESHWYLSRRGPLYHLLKRALQNAFGIILSGTWRRIVWKVHTRCTYMADADNARHLVAVARGVYSTTSHTR